MFSGYGGLDIALATVLGAKTVWVADVCKFDKKTGATGHHEPHRAPCSILAHRFRGVPNLGDVSHVDWSSVSPVDVLCAGFPCQDVSVAGNRAGLKEGTRTGLWSEVVRAIKALKPRMVVLENVPGIFTASADSDVEPCAWCVGVESGGGLRALDAVLADLSEIGMDAVWTVVPASAVGAPHRRERWFLVAYPRGEHGIKRWITVAREATPGGTFGEPARRDRAPLMPTPMTTDAGSNSPGDNARNAPGLRCLPSLLPTPQAVQTGPNARQFSDRALLPTPRASRGASNTETVAMLPEPSAADGSGGKYNSDGHQDSLPGIVRMLPTPRATDGTKGGPNQRGSSGDLMLPSAVALLPTPAVNDMGAAYTPDEWDAWTAKMQAKHGNGNGHGKSLSIEAQRLLPTPSVADVEGGHKSRSGARRDELLLNGIAAHERWGEYAEAITGWERQTRTAPLPTRPSARTGRPQLAPEFSEWMMGLEAGWVTDIPGIGRPDALKALGNGVVPQQAAAAIDWLLDWLIEVAA